MPEYTPEQVLSPPIGLLECAAIISSMLPLATGVSLVVMSDPARLAFESPDLRFILLDIALFLVGTCLTVIYFRLARGTRRFIPMHSFIDPREYRTHWWWGKPGTVKGALPRVYLKVKEIPAFLTIAGSFLLLALLRALMPLPPERSFISPVLILLGGIIVFLSLLMVLLSTRTHEEIREGPEYVLGEEGVGLVSARDLAGTPAFYVPPKREILAILSIMVIFIGISLVYRLLPGKEYPFSPGVFTAGINTAALVIGIIIIVNGVTKGGIPQVAGDWRLLGLPVPIVEGEDRRKILEKIDKPQLKKMELRPVRSGLLSLICPGLGQIYNGESEKGLLYGCFLFFICSFQINIALSFYVFFILDGFFNAKRLEKAGQASAILDEHALILLLVVFILLAGIYGGHSLAEYYFKTEIPWYG